MLFPFGRNPARETRVTWTPQQQPHEREQRQSMRPDDVPSRLPKEYLVHSDVLIAAIGSAFRDSLLKAQPSAP